MGTRSLALMSTCALALFGCDGPVEGGPDGTTPTRDGGMTVIAPDAGPVCVPSGSTESTCGDDVDDDCDGLLDCMDPDCSGQACDARDGFTCMAGGCARSFASELPELTGVDVEVRGDSAVVTFLPTAGARDYRIYALPDPSAVSEASDGSLTIEGATYRCAGDRPLDEIDPPAVDGDVLFYERDASRSTLGHVFLTPGEGRRPVYVLRDPTRDEYYSGLQFNLTRVPFHTTDPAERARLISEGWRDDGVAFYVPESGDGVMLHRFDSVPQGWLQMRTFTLIIRDDDPELADRRGGEGEVEPMFAIPDAPIVVDGVTQTVPLYRLFYALGALHDELAPGDAIRQRVERQGNQPVTALTWSGMTERTTLVVEALDRGCPFTSILGPIARDAVEHAEPFVSLDAARSASASGELFINAQHDPSGNPVPTHRSYVTVTPEAAPSGWDFYADFSATGLGQTWEEVDRQTGVPGVRYRSELFDLHYYATEEGTDSYGPVMGEMWIGFADWAADTNGKVRLSPHARGAVAEGTFFHATMEANLPSTGRRYPQMLISTEEAPLIETMSGGTTLVVQSFGAATELQIQKCDHRGWDVNDQCPGAALSRREIGGEERFLPNPLVAEVVGFDRRNRVDAYVSTDRVYVYLDGRPYGCVDRSGLMPAGPVSVHFGSVLYHSGVDESVVCDDCPHRYLREHNLTQTMVHYDNLGFESGVALPGWDHGAMPCATELDGG